jgi:hypothetical protein
MNTRKENKNAYKQMKFRKGIFQIRNLTNGKLFLKISTDLDRAYNSDHFQLRLGSHPNKELQNDWNSLGAESFEFGLFDELKTNENATEKETKKELTDFLDLCRTELLNNGNNLY